MKEDKMNVFSTLFAPSESTGYLFSLKVNPPILYMKGGGGYHEFLIFAFPKCFHSWSNKKMEDFRVPESLTLAKYI